MTPQVLAFLICSAVNILWASADSGSSARQLYVIGDSTLRHMLFDFVAGTHDCAGNTTSSTAVSSGGSSHNSLCASLSIGRSKRESYDFLLEGEALSKATSGSAILWPRQGVSRIEIHFRSATVVRNVTAEPWFNEALGMVKKARSPFSNTTVLMSLGLWNLRYDEPRASESDVPGRYLTELMQLFRLIDAAAPSQAAGDNNLYWRALTPVERERNPSFVAGYDAPLVLRANAAATKLALEEGGFNVVDLNPLLSFARGVAHATTASSLLTVDGTHYPAWLNNLLMQEVLAAITSAGRDRDDSDRGPGAAGGPLLIMAKLPRGNLSAVSDSTTKLVLPSTEGDAGTPTWAVFLSTITATLSALALLRRHEQIAQALQSAAPITLTFAVVVALVHLLDGVGILPRVKKDPAVGVDMQLGLFSVILLAAMLTWTKSAPAQATTPSQHSRGTVETVDVAPQSSANDCLGFSGPLALPTDDSTAGPTTDPEDVDAPDVRVVRSVPSHTRSPIGTATSNSSCANDGGTDSSGPWDVMSRDLTNELKGLCMSFFLLYHYWDVKAVYNPVRVMVAAFLFLTGYGNFLSLSSKGPSWHKFSLSFIRINLLVALLMAVVQQPWLLYYICPLHTFWTAVVYLFFAVLPPWNGDTGSSDVSSSSSERGTNRARLTKLVVLTSILVVAFEAPHVRTLLFAPFYPFLRYRGSLYEWEFRSTLDAYAPLAGMWMAHFKPDIVAILAKLNSHRRMQQGVGVALAGLMLAHGWTFYSLPKGAYNATHRFSGLIPLILYLPLRNLTPWLSAHYCGLFSALGKASLEFYLLQFHLWLSNNSKTVVHVFPGNPKAFPFSAFAVQTVIFSSVAWCLAQAQDGLLKRLGNPSNATVTCASAVVLAFTLAVLSWVADRTVPSTAMTGT